MSVIEQSTSVANGRTSKRQDSAHRQDNASAPSASNQKRYDDAAKVVSTFSEERTVEILETAHARLGLASLTIGEVQTKADEVIGIAEAQRLPDSKQPAIVATLIKTKDELVHQHEKLRAAANHSYELSEAGKPREALLASEALFNRTSKNSIQGLIVDGQKMLEELEEAKRLLTLQNPSISDRYQRFIMPTTLRTWAAALLREDPGEFTTGKNLKDRTEPAPYVLQALAGPSAAAATKAIAGALLSSTVIHRLFTQTTGTDASGLFADRELIALPKQAPADPVDFARGRAEFRRLVGQGPRDQKLVRGTVTKELPRGSFDFPSTYAGHPDSTKTSTGSAAQTPRGTVPPLVASNESPKSGPSQAEQPVRAADTDKKGREKDQQESVGKEDHGKPTLDMSDGTLLIRIPKAALASLPATMPVDGATFNVKSEHHITALGYGIGKVIQKAIAAKPSLKGEIDALIERTDWSFSTTRDWFHIKKDYNISERNGVPAHTEHRESVVARVNMPGMQQFYSELAQLLGQQLETPPPHVTLYTHSSPKGIGITSEREFESLNPVRVEPPAIRNFEGWYDQQSADLLKQMHAQLKSATSADGSVSGVSAITKQGDNYAIVLGLVDNSVWRGGEMRYLCLERGLTKTIVFGPSSLVDGHAGLFELAKKIIPDSKTGTMKPVGGGLYELTREQGELVAKTYGYSGNFGKEPKHFDAQRLISDALKELHK